MDSHRKLKSTWHRRLAGRAALLVSLLAVACGDDDVDRTDAFVLDSSAPGSDLGPSDAGQPTSLEGDLACGDLTCASGEVCVTRFSGVDLGTGVGATRSCEELPTGCGELYDCSDSSSDAPDCCDPIHACAREFCMYPEPPACETFGGGGVDVDGRMVECGGI